jgi:ABC-type nitrate/sulfonate/bicarbonate transport system permease component
MNNDYGKNTSIGERVKDASLPVLIVMAIIFAWEAFVHLADIQSYVLPAPSAIVAEFIDSGTTVIIPQMWVTIAEVLAGYAVAIGVAAILSVLILYSRNFRQGVLPLIVASQTIPVIAIAPVLVIWFGYNMTPRIIITALVAFFPLTISTVSGLQSLDRQFIDFFRSLNARESQIFFRLRLPVALPSIFAGLKVGATLAVIGATISEWVGASAGLGFLIAQDTAQLNTTRVFASIVILGMCGMSLFSIVTLIERISMPWIYRRPSWAWLRSLHSPAFARTAVRTQ